jgi:hypothetical protein
VPATRPTARTNRKFKALVSREVTTVLALRAGLKNGQPFRLYL